MERECKTCQQTFSLSAIELENHNKLVATIGEQKIALPLPTHCSNCSNQKRLRWINYSNLYSRTCDACQKEIITMYRPDSDYIVYCADCYLDKTNSQLDYDKNQSFFSQFRQLMKIQPWQALNNDSAGAANNSAYTNYAAKNQNCYLLFGGGNNEDCYYCCQIQASRNCADCTFCENVELCTEMLNCYCCYNSSYLVNCRSSRDCYFSYDLSNCSHCLFSSGLRNKEYYIFNKAYSKEEYEKYRQDNFYTASFSRWQQLVEQFETWYQNTVRQNLNNRQTEECLGNDLQYSKNTSGFYVNKSEDCRNLLSGNLCKNVSDIFSADSSELCYQGVNIRRSYNIICSSFCVRSDNVLYSLRFKDCKNCFGCVGLINKEYCILNKQYSKEAYEDLVLHIIREMQEDGAWGEFFADEFSPFHYEETFANDVFPMEKPEFIISSYVSTLPDNINDTDSTITKDAQTCFTCSKAYRITEQELSLSKQLQIPLPRSCYHCRHEIRQRRRPNFRLHKTTCTQCHKDIHTNYHNDQGLKIYCEDCYQNTIVIN